jgi:hypothetical protein
MFFEGTRRFHEKFFFFMDYAGPSHCAAAVAVVA